MSTLSVVRKRVEQLHRSFEKCPSIYFNESDLQAELFALLLRDFGGVKRVENVFVWGPSRGSVPLPFMTRMLHSELLLPDGRIDLAILDLAHVRFAMNSQGRFGHVQLEDGDHVFVETKASRTNRSAITCRGTWTELIRSDIEKLNRFPYRGILLCFDFGALLDDAEICALSLLVKSNVELSYCKSALRDRYLARTSA